MIVTQEMRTLMGAYHDNGVALDRLSQNPWWTLTFCHAARRNYKVNMSAMQIMQTLMRLRKKGIKKVGFPSIEHSKPQPLFMPKKGDTFTYNGV